MFLAKNLEHWNSRPFPRLLVVFLLQTPILREQLVPFFSAECLLVQFFFIARRRTKRLNFRKVLKNSFIFTNPFNLVLKYFFLSLQGPDLASFSDFLLILLADALEFDELRFDKVCYSADSWLHVEDITASRNAWIGWLISSAPLFAPITFDSAHWAAYFICVG